ncbi:MAG: SPFH domain-containing protein, partial [Gammaproteobacteria bacterium]
MKNRIYLQFAAGLAALAIICIGLFLATYAVHPGEAVLLVRGDKVVAVEHGPGLRWKIPLVEGVVRLDARTQLAEGRVLAASASTGGLAIRYAAFWRISDPKTYYQATTGDAGAVAKQLGDALSPVFAKAMSAGDARQFLTGPVPQLDANVEAAVKPVARKNGISVLGVHLGVSDIPTKLAGEVTDTMTAGTRAEITKAKAAGTARQTAIAAAAASHRAAVMAGARRKA